MLDEDNFSPRSVIDKRVSYENKGFIEWCHEQEMEVIKRKGSNRCGWIVSACVERERMGLEREREGGRERGRRQE
jgi:hypothetical protein